MEDAEHIDGGEVISFNCPDCMETYGIRRVPKLLPCGHTNCLTCLDVSRFAVFYLVLSTATWFYVYFLKGIFDSVFTRATCPLCRVFCKIERGTQTLLSDFDFVRLIQQNSDLPEQKRLLEC